MIFFGGMAGYTMICQSGINVRSDVRGWLSLLTAGVFLMFLIVVLGEWVVVIRMPVLAAIMAMVSIGTYDESSFNHLRKAWDDSGAGAVHRPRYFQYPIAR